MLTRPEFNRLTELLDQLICDRDDRGDPRAELLADAYQAIEEIQRQRHPEPGDTVRVTASAPLGVSPFPESTRFVGTVHAPFTTTFVKALDNPRLPDWVVVSVSPDLVQFADHCDGDYPELCVMVQETQVEAVS